MKRILTALASTAFTIAAFAQPTFKRPKTTAGSSTSKTANQMADNGMYKAI